MGPIKGIIDIGMSYPSVVSSLIFHALPATRVVRKTLVKRTCTYKASAAGRPLR